VAGVMVAPVLMVQLLMSPLGTYLRVISFKQGKVFDCKFDSFTFYILGLNTIAHLNNHFAKYGTLVNVQVHFEGDPSSALVTFSSPMEAEAAVASPEAVLGMRFIRIFLHTERPTNPPTKPTGKGDMVAKLPSCLHSRRSI
jgi:hypothetical protein